MRNATPRHWPIIRRTALRWWWFICAVACVLGSAHSVKADVAPPEQPPGSSISPAKTTQVRMLDEQIVLDVQSLAMASDARPQAEVTLQAQVSGRFTMRNLGATEERLQVRFPLGDPRGHSDGFGRYPQVQAFTATVGAQPAVTTVISTPNSEGGNAPPVPWAAFDVIFPPAQEVSIRITYTISPTDMAPFRRFAYVLQTGAGWRDSIGRAEISVRLPYPANLDTVRGATPGATLAANTVRWQLTDFEPTEANDIFFMVLAPQVWQAITTAEAATAARPADSAALVHLALAYEAAVTYHGVTVDPADPFIARSETTYQAALRLAPKAADLWAGFAALVWHHQGYQGIPDLGDLGMQRVLVALSTALTLNPVQPEAHALLTEIEGMVGGPVVLPTVAPLTPTQPPSPTLPLAPSATVVPPTLVPPTLTPATANAEPGQAGMPSGWLGGGVLVLVGLVALVVWVRRQR